MSLYRVTFAALAALFTIGMTSMASACCDIGYSAPVAYATVAPAGFGGCGTCGAPTAITAAPIAVSNVLPTPFGGPCCGFTGCGDCLTWGCVSCGGCGTCGAAPVAWNGCGTCGAPVAYNGCGGCGAGYAVAPVGYGCGTCGAVSYAAPVSYGCGGCGGYAASSLYVVNQGPVYSGPGVTEPYSTYSPEMAYAPATDYPYTPGYGYGAPAYPHYYARPYYRPYYHAYRRPYYGPRYAYRAPYHRYYAPVRRYYRYR